MYRPKVGISPLMFPCLLQEFLAYIVILSITVTWFIPLVTHGFFLSSHSSSHLHARAWMERWVGAGSVPRHPPTGSLGLMAPKTYTRFSGWPPAGHRPPGLNLLIYSEGKYLSEQMVFLPG